jgi:hypothetical protein
MPLSLEQYATDYLSTRDLPWPTMPKVEAPKARPSLHPLAVRAVLWNVYGTLLAIPTGELQYEAQIDFVTDAALEKTIKEFNMWNSMSRKPGAPSAYMKEIFKNTLAMLRMTGGGGERYPEVLAERVWDDIVKKLAAKDYKYDVTLYGPHGEFTKKIAYFYHASIQGTGCYEGAAEALRLVAESGRRQGLLADGQCFTPAQLLQGLRSQEPGFDLQAAIPNEMRFLSHEKKARKPSETLFQAAVTALASRGVSPSEILHVGSNLARDIAPAKKFGMKTALFAGDKASLSATPEQLKDPHFRPDVLLTELPQIAEVLA